MTAGSLTNGVVRARAAHEFVAWVFLVGIGAQVFLAGLGIFAGPGWWAQHRGFVHALEVLPILLLLLAWIGQMPRSLKILSVAPFGLIALQYATIEMRIPVLAAFHPVNAILLFGLVLALAQQSRRLSAA
jgi:membrane-bound metal-dependent hydrolase YbcI (DUF457 family)